MRFVWEIDRGGYRWSEEHELSPMPSRVDSTVRRMPQGPWLVAPQAWGTPRPVLRYAPLRRRRDLNVEFARLSPSDDPQARAAMARFAARFGLLGGGQLVHPIEPEADGQRPLYYAEHLWTWVQAISTLKGLNELIGAYKHGDTEKLRKCVKWKRDPPRVVFTYTWPNAPAPSMFEIAREGDGHGEDKLARWSKATGERESVLEPTEHFLYDRLSDHLRKHVAPQLVPQVGVVTVPDSLLGALYLMAAEQLVGAWPTKVCANCGIWFVPRARRDQKTCSDSCRQKWYRSRRKEEEHQR